MDVEFKYSVGAINNVLEGDIDREDSLADLDYSFSNSGIIIPKVIGVYQEDTNIPKGVNSLGDKLSQLGILVKTGKMDRYAPSLICIAYDPTNLPRGLLENTIQDPLGRVKVVDYADMPDFYEKNVPEHLAISDMLNPEGITDIRKSVLDRQKNIWELLKRDYGLTRKEGVDLLAVSLLLEKIGDKRIIKDISPSDIKKSILNSLLRDSFDKFLRE